MTCLIQKAVSYGGHILTAVDESLRWAEGLCTRYQQFLFLQGEGGGGAEAGYSLKSGGQEGPH